jgi:hypothetical protein
MPQAPGDDCISAPDKSVIHKCWELIEPSAAARPSKSPPEERIANLNEYDPRKSAIATFCAAIAAKIRCKGILPVSASRRE